MTRTRVESPAVSSWEDAGAVLRHYGEAGIDIRTHVGRALKAINKIKEIADRKCKPLIEQQERDKLQLQQFVEAHRAELTGKGKKKTKALTYGKCGFRASTRLLKLEGDGEIIALLREFGYLDCVRVTEEPDLAAIKKLGEETIGEVGCLLEHLDAFWLEPDEVKIEEARK